MAQTPPKRKPDGWQGATTTTKRILPRVSTTGAAGRASVRQSGQRHPREVAPTPRSTEKKPPNRRTK